MLRRAVAAASIALATLSGGPARADEILVGAHMPLTGSLARSGQAFDEGMRVAIQMFNAGPQKHKIRLQVIDDESTPAKAVSAVEKLVSDGAVAVIGGYGSNIIGPASDASNRLKTTYITAGAVSDELTARGLKTFFRINNNAGYQRGMGTLLESLKPTSVSILASTKEAPALLAKGLQKDLAAKGVKVTVHEFDPAITDFKPVINKVKLQDKSDILVMSAYENDYVGIIRAAKVLKPPVKLIVGAWSLATPKMHAEFPDLMNNVVGTSFLPFPVEMKDEEGKRFAETYKKTYNKEVEYLSTLSFVETTILAEAIARAADAGTLKTGGLPDAMRRTERETLLGPVQFDATGDNPRFTVAMGQHRAGKIVLVSPASAATGEIAFPALPW
ncbi:ABC transporter substrate-binding protein [Methylobacterium radiodurans]|uniref:Branched-chain amino acid ABC transporter substrate-binding protein n=1 Tax=Methylobacterium radiodurans TaxID=2202828 RepID=A0A2U8VML8_9HYPH|nr:ABC transporter substrate-binding protein [Methylobacterium radiodurans]AWN34718.1 branched-chain amino acid ABC transporter substrate-binding protein [Methylobacterium radiodurans]